MSDVEIVISQWNSFKAYKYLPRHKPYLKENQMDRIDFHLTNTENFLIIQVVKMNHDKIVFEGFSKESGNWLVYEFDTPHIEIIFNIN